MTTTNTARIDYTTETRRGAATRKSKEVKAATGEKLALAVAKAIAKLEDAGAYQVETRWEVAPAPQELPTAMVDRAKAANLHAWNERTSAAHLIAADAWEEAGDEVAARMNREAAAEIITNHARNPLVWTEA